MTLYEQILLPDRMRLVADFHCGVACMRLLTCTTPAERRHWRWHYVRNVRERARIAESSST